MHISLSGVRDGGRRRYDSRAENKCRIESHPGENRRGLAYGNEKGMQQRKEMLICEMTGTLEMKQDVVNKNNGAERIYVGVDKDEGKCV